MNRSEFPNSGWVFFQPQTGWRNPMPLAYTFDQTVEEIIKHRLKNPAITKQHKLATDFSTVADELETFTKKRLGLVDAFPKTLSPVRQILARVGLGAVAARNIAIGAQNLLAWSDSGKVVPKELADARAVICTSGGPNGRCPMNGSGDWKTIFTEPAAELIQRQLSAKNSMKLETKYDASLGVCEACACPLQLKVWAPLEYALRKMSKETKDKLPEWCWMKMGK